MHKLRFARDRGFLELLEYRAEVAHAE
jgi:hypothetical protein